MGRHDPSAKRSRSRAVFRRARVHSLSRSLPIPDTGGCLRELLPLCDLARGEKA